MDARVCTTVIDVAERETEKDLQVIQYPNTIPVYYMIRPFIISELSCCSCSSYRNLSISFSPSNGETLPPTR